MSAGIFFAIGMVTGACLGWPTISTIYYREGYRAGRQGRWNWVGRKYMRRVADLLDVQTEGEDAGEVVEWALKEADKPMRTTP